MRPSLRCRWRHRGPVAALLALMALLVVPLPTQADTFLRLTGPNGQVPGEVTAVGYVNQIEVSNWSWGAKNVFAFDPSGGMELGKPSYESFTFTKKLDRSTARFLDFLRDGTVLASAKLTVVKPQADRLTPYLDYCLENVVVSGYEISMGDGSEPPTEHVTLDAGKFSQRYALWQDGKVAAYYTTGVDVFPGKGIPYNARC